jgi:hypothetical protein
MDVIDHYHVAQLGFDSFKEHESTLLSAFISCKSGTLVTSSSMIL